MYPHVPGHPDRLTISMGKTPDNISGKVPSIARKYHAQLKKHEGAYTFFPYVLANVDISQFNAAGPGGAHHSLLRGLSKGLAEFGVSLSSAEADEWSEDFHYAVQNAYFNAPVNQRATSIQHIGPGYFLAKVFEKHAKTLDAWLEDAAGPDDPDNVRSESVETYDVTEQNTFRETVRSMRDALTEISGGSVKGELLSESVMVQHRSGVRSMAKLLRLVVDKNPDTDVPKVVRKVRDLAVGLDLRTELWPEDVWDFIDVVEENDILKYAASHVPADSKDIARVCINNWKAFVNDTRKGSKGYNQNRAERNNPEDPRFRPAKLQEMNHKLDPWQKFERKVREGLRHLHWILFWATNPQINDNNEVIATAEKLLEPLKVLSDRAPIDVRQVKKVIEYVESNNVVAIALKAINKPSDLKASGEEASGWKAFVQEYKAGKINPEIN